MRKPPSVLRSSLCRGTIAHTRRTDPPHHLSRETYMLLLDIDELDALEERLYLFGHRRSRPTRFCDEDHFFEPHRPIREALTEIVGQAGRKIPDGRILVLTHARVLGHVFNPVSFFWWYDADGEVALRVAEVDNTYGDRHVYLLDGTDDPQPTAPKRLHVSPFLQPSGTYRFQLPDPGAGTRLRLGVDLFDGEEVLLQARVVLDREPLTDRALLSAMARRPMISARGLTGIHAEAFRLWRKGAHFRDRPDYGSDFTTRVSK